MLKQLDLHWHDLRHEALSRLGEAGVPAHDLKALAGHANLSTTQRYLNSQEVRMHQAVRAAKARLTDKSGNPESGHGTVTADELRHAIEMAPVEVVENKEEMVPRARIELATLRFSVVCSTN